MRNRFFLHLFLAALLSVSLSVFTCEGRDVLVEAESFTEKGGWKVDQQFMDQMGSPYLLAHGMGVPVEDACTDIDLKKGEWHVWVRTYNWTSPWHSGKGPGAFRVAVGGKTLPNDLGVTGHSWEWQYAGAVTVKGGSTEIRLHDMTGFDGRCDAVLLTRGGPQEPADVQTLRSTKCESIDKNYDLVVAGGGIAGMCAAAAAARNGLKVALVNDRPVLGGNNSSEIRVHLGGYVEMEPYKGLGRMIREFGHTEKGNARPAENYQDWKKQAFIDAEENIDLYAPYHVMAVDTEASEIGSVTAVHIETGENVRLHGRLFADCTGDGTVGFLAGADWTMGRESRDEYGERSAPVKADDMVMGASVQWYSRKCPQKTVFPEFSYGVEFNASNCEKVTMGEWTWETGMNRDQIADAERVRDYGLLVIYSNWSWLKNHSGDAAYADRSLDWVAYIAGKRESRRLLGDHVLSQNDIDRDIQYEDASFTTTWSVDLHFPDPKNSGKFPGNEFKSATVHDWIHPYAVPYRCLYSRNIGNLFMAGRDISCTHVALGTVRVMRTTGMMGEVVGMAAALCIKNGCLPRGVYQHHLSELKRMMEAGAGRTDVPLLDQNFNLPNKLLKNAPASDKGYARLTCDTLFVGNALIERAFRWNGGNLTNAYVKDKTTGRVFVSNTVDPALEVGQSSGAAADGKLTVREVKSDGIRPEHLEAEVTFSMDDIRVRRVFRVYEGCPAIACDNYVGGISAGKEQSAGNVADNKNIESVSDMRRGQENKARYLERFCPGGMHWQVKVVEFFDVTDWNNNLVAEHSFIPYRKTGYRGNLLFARDARDENGFFILKEAPCSAVQLGSPDADFICESGKFTVAGIGISDEDAIGDDMVRLYSCVTGVFGEGGLSPLLALRNYQKHIREHHADRDEMIMMNTWGDRSQDSKVNEQFCIAELEKAARLGVTHFQIDDGWQEGKSPNSALAKGSFKNIWDNPLYWTPSREKYPRGLKPVMDKARELGIEIGLWFNPSIQNDFADWRKDADAVVKLYDEYGIKVFKIDGLSIPTKQAETNLRKFFDTVLAETGNEVVFNLDVTAGRRGGYHFLNEYGNIFLENRYTDWQNYYPYWTLRNIWQLSRYVPAERLQTEFLNKWRNADKYAGDPFAPALYEFPYVFAVAMAGQPLAWMEASNLPEEAFALSSVVKAYKSVMNDFHQGTILPIGDEPDGKSWTGFQSISAGNRTGFVLVLREKNEEETCAVKTWLTEGQKVSLSPVTGGGKSFGTVVDEGGSVKFSLPSENTFALYKYEIL